LARPEYLDSDISLIQRALGDRLLLHKGGSLIHYPDFMFQYRRRQIFRGLARPNGCIRKCCGGITRLIAPKMKPKFSAFFVRIFTEVLTGTDAPFPALRRK
jgi:NitT/TauT family transport system ATP-binding protein